MFELGVEGGSNGVAAATKVGNVGSTGGPLFRSSRSPHSDRQQEGEGRHTGPG